jgi:hypothetical protein
MMLMLMLVLLFTTTGATHLCFPIKLVVFSMAWHCCVVMSEIPPRDLRRVRLETLMLFLPPLSTGLAFFIFQGGGEGRE